jgi:hypothetical protein
MGGLGWGRQDFVPHPTPPIVQLINKISAQPDNGQHAGPKHVVVTYVIEILLCLWLYVYLYTQYKLPIIQALCGDSTSPVFITVSRSR